MRAYRGRALLLALPLKSLIQRFAFVLLVGAAIAIMILSRAEPRLVDNLRGAVGDAATPILEFFSHPAASFASLVEEIDAALNVHEENARLEEQNAQLLKWQAVAEHVSRENAQLRQILHAVPDPDASFITARVISDSGGPFVRTVMINAGEPQILERRGPQRREDSLGSGRRIDVAPPHAREQVFDVRYVHEAPAAAFSV